MVKTKLFAVTMAASLFLAGCERTRPLSGEVFIVTQGREKVKLGLVEVGIFDADKVSGSIRETKAQLAPEVQKMKEVLPKLQELRSTADKQWQTALDGNYKRGDNDRLSDLKMETAALCDEASNYAAYLQSSALFFEKLPAALATVKTNADGKFGLTIPSRAIVVGAFASRRVPSGDTESYYWLVRVDPGTDTITLSSDNLMSSSNPHSVVWASEQTGKSGGPADILAARGEDLRLELIASSPDSPLPPVDTKRAPTPTPAPLPVVVTVKRPVKVRVTYGEVTLQPGTKLQVISRKGATLFAQFGNDNIQVPVSATDLQ
jgi:hypothetical protein